MTQKLLNFREIVTLGVRKKERWWR